MSIVRQYHADTNTTYVYESTSYWDKDKGQSRSKRKLIGKIDPVTGEIVPTGGRGRKKKTSAPSEAASSNIEVIRLNEVIASLQKEKMELASENAALRQQNLQLSSRNEKLAAAIRKISNICIPAMEEE